MTRFKINARSFANEFVPSHERINIDGVLYVKRGGRWFSSKKRETITNQTLFTRLRGAERLDTECNNGVAIFTTV